MQPTSEDSGVGTDVSACPVHFVDVVAEVVRKHGDDIAVADPTGRLTYRELDRWSDAIAADLDAAVGRGGDPVMVLSHHDTAAVAAFLAVAKCGRPVVMLDSTAPAGRMQDIADLARPSATLYAADRASQVDLIGADTGMRIPIPGRPGNDVTPFAGTPLTDETPLSIVFTSGSTGRPKGVIIGSVPFVAALTAAASAGGNDQRVLCPVPLGFVFGLSLLVRTLTRGSELHLHDPRVLGVQSLAARIDDDRITEVGATPYIVRSLAQSIRPGQVFGSIRRVLLGSEAVLTRDVAAVRGFTGEGCIIANSLGSSEAWGVTSLVMDRDFVLPDQTFMPVGTPAPGREVVLVGEDGEVVTERMRPGVIHLIAQHMSGGYWRDAESTAARFSTLEDGRRSYNTGDLGRWNVEGQLEYLGRADNMVKVRGYLVEPAEVESHIRATGEVDDVVVVGRPSTRGDGSTALVAYVVPTLNAWISGAAIRRHLVSELPSYMVPAQVVELTALPRNPNGKIDRLTLPEPPPPATPASVRKYEYEEAIADVAAATLGLEAIGVDDDLFELGLDSLAVEEMVAILEDQLDLQISSATIMQNPTAAQLARLPHGNAEHLVDGVMTMLAPGDGSPIFAISGAGGLALQLRELAQQLHLGRPVYGIQAHGLEGNAFPDRTIAQMARRYLRTIRRIQPSGPYSILGHSLGSIVAFDLVRRLVAANEEVAFLGLLDPPDASTIERSALLSSLSASDVAHGEHRSAVGRLRDELAERYPFATRSFWRRVHADGRFHPWFEAGASAARRYRLHDPLAVTNACVYLAEGTPATAAEHWFSTPATIVNVPGDHLSMLRRPYVAELAARVSEHVEAR
ncbi:hypothetical protein GCM10028798_14430 [Humibacter antri]